MVKNTLKQPNHKNTSERWGGHRRRGEVCRARPPRAFPAGCGTLCGGEVLLFGREYSVCLLLFTTETGEHEVLRPLLLNLKCCFHQYQSIYIYIYFFFYLFIYVERERYSVYIYIYYIYIIIVYVYIYIYIHIHIHIYSHRLRRPGPGVGQHPDGEDRAPAGGRPDDSQ